MIKLNINARNRRSTWSEKTREFPVGARKPDRTGKVVWEQRL